MSSTAVSISQSVNVQNKHFLIQSSKKAETNSKINNFLMDQLGKDLYKLL